jgi:5-methylcytosine-specific restriction endonuclease McrA
MPRKSGKLDPYKWQEDNHDKAIPLYVRRRLILDAGDLCRSCRVRVRPGSGHIDHVTPLEDGGEHGWGNLQYLCPLCHGAKTSKENSARSKGNRVLAKTYGLARPKRPFPKFAKPKPEPTLKYWYFGPNGELRVCTLKASEIPEGE